MQKSSRFFGYTFLVLALIAAMAAAGGAIHQYSLAGLCGGVSLLMFIDSRKKPEKKLNQ